MAGIDFLTLALAKKYADSVVAGATEGTPCQIQSIEPITGGNRVTFLWEDGDGEEHTSTMDVMDGEKGEDGDAGPAGADGAAGADGFSPTITVKTSTDSDYILTITNANGSFDTPNLKASAGDLSAYQTKTLSTPITIGGVEYTTVESTLEALSSGSSAGVVYGFHVDGTESDPSACITYIEDAVGMIPAGMNYTTDEFTYGSWEDAFFMPRPCMVKADGTVDYYLDPDDYTKKADGTASDITDMTYGGNVMMEWGQNGKKIWYKIVVDATGESANVYVSDHQVDQHYHAWSFINNQGVMVDHFYTPVYTGSYDTDGKLRSMSGVATSSFALSHNQAYDVTAAKANNTDSDVLWNTEVFADVILINILLVLMGKSLNTQTVFGMGNCYGSLQATGTLDDKGLFYGTNTKTVGVKVFGMEHWWGNSWRRYIGHNLLDGEHIYKLTYGTQDGSSVNGYVDSATASDYSGYISSGVTLGGAGYLKTVHFNNGAFFPKTTGGSYSTYYCDNIWKESTGIRQVQRGGSDATDLQSGAFCAGLDLTPAQTHSRIGSCLSCKPKAVSE